jgi:Uma2 family endonuclease
VAVRQVIIKQGPHRWADFIRLPEEDRRELIDGHLVTVEVPTKWHEWVVGYVVQLLGVWASKHGGRVLVSGYKVKVSSTRGAMPDIQFLSEKTYRAAAPTGLSNGRPELVVEVISPSSRAHDRLTKMQWYAAIGVPEYWLIDVDRQRLERYRLEQGLFVVVEVLTGRKIFKPDSFKGLRVPLGTLWDSKIP